MRPPRFRLPTVLASVAAAAIALWLIRTAILVENDWKHRTLFHLFVMPDPATPAFGLVCPLPTPYWPRFWRRLLGLPWPGSFDCGCRARPPDRFPPDNPEAILVATRAGDGHSYPVGEMIYDYYSTHGGWPPPWHRGAHAPPPSH